MKSILKSISIFLFVLGSLLGCQPEPSLSVSVSSINISDAESENTISITSNTAWSISGGGGWSYAVPSSGEGSATVKLVASKNTSNTERSATILVTAGSLSGTVVITQKQNNALILTKKTENLDNSARTINVELKSNIEYDIVMPTGVNWITNVKSKAFNTFSHEFLIAQNTSYDNRSAIVIFKDKNSLLADTLTINQAKTSALILTNRTENVSSQGGTLSVELKSNISYNIVIPSQYDWISLTPTKGLSTYTHQIYVSQNTQFDSRTGIVIFRDKYSTLADTLTINQQELNAIILGKENYYIQKSGGTINYTVSSNIDYDINVLVGGTWISQLPTKGMITSQFSFIAAANTSNTDRYGKIVITQKGGSISDTLNIKQTSFDGYYIYREASQELSSQIPDADRTNLKRLKIEGNFKSTDFPILTNLLKDLEHLDISQASLENNSIPEAAFKTLTTPLHLQTISFPSSLQTIGKEAFYNCGNLTELTLTANITSIGESAFGLCSSLARVTSLINRPFAVSQVFQGINSNADLIVPVGTLSNYLSSVGWGFDFFHRIYEVGSSPESYIFVRQNSIKSSGAGGIETINLDASSPWVIESKPSWVSTSLSSGTGSTAIDLTFGPYSGETLRSGSIVFRLTGTTYTASIALEQFNFTFKDGDYVTIQQATTGGGVNIVFVGDGYSIYDMASKKYENNIRAGVAHFFAVEPYKSYAQYFNVYMVYAFSQESGISDLTKTLNTTFETKYTKEPPYTSMSTNTATCFTYAQKAPISNVNKTLVVLVANSTRYAGTCWLYSNGAAVAICPLSNSSYPYDFRGIIQHEAGGHGFGKLADEYTTTTGPITQSQSTSLKTWQTSYGHYLNVDLTSNLSTILWKHFIGQPNYSYVGAYEGAYYYTQGVWRSENKSLMINNINYISAPGRELIVKRIKSLAGMTYSFDDFKAHDVMELSASTKGEVLFFDPTKQLAPPVMIEGKP